MARAAGRSRQSMLARPSVTIPGWWQSIRDMHEAAIALGDPRAFEMSKAAQARLNSSPYSTVGGNRRALQSMDRGQPQIHHGPSSAVCASLGADWMNEPGRAETMLWVFPDDRCEAVLPEDKGAEQVWRYPGWKYPAPKSTP